MIEFKLILAAAIGIISIACLLILFKRLLPGYFLNNPKNVSNLISRSSVYQSIEDSSAPVASATLLKSIEEADKIGAIKTSSSLQRKFRYAQWSMSPALFRAFEFSISLLFFSLAALKFNVVVQIAALFTGPLIMHGFLSSSISRRFKAFDADYAQYLMQVVGLLKTGMTPMTALQEAARGLEPDSLVRKEVLLMIERVRFGIAEEKSIGAFGEDIDHPEIELFVQALILSRRLGGNLSETLERLSVQVRKRQYFRSSAEASISLQRGSLWLILAIMIALEGYIALLYPELIMKSFDMEIGRHIWQVCIVLIGVGVVWIRQVTKIKI